MCCADGGARIQGRARGRKVGPARWEERLQATMRKRLQDERKNTGSTRYEDRLVCGARQTDNVRGETGAETDRGQRPADRAPAGRGAQACAGGQANRATADQQSARAGEVVGREREQQLRAEDALGTVQRRITVDFEEMAVLRIVERRVVEESVVGGSARGRVSATSR